MLDGLDKFFSLSPAKSVITSVLTIAAFWYVDIFLFNRELIHQERFFIPFIIAFCLSFVWNVITLVLSFTLFHKPQQTQGLYPERDQLAAQEWASKCFFWNILISVLLLAFCTLLELFIGFSFNTYVLISFSLIILATLIRYYLLNRPVKVKSQEQ